MRKYNQQHIEWADKPFLLREKWLCSILTQSKNSTKSAGPAPLQPTPIGYIIGSIFSELSLSQENLVVQETHFWMCGDKKPI